MQNNETIQVIQLGFDFIKDMSISDWIRAPFLFVNNILKFLIRNFASIIIILVTLIIIYYIIKFIRWWKRQRDEDEIGGVGEDEYEELEEL